MPVSPPSSCKSAVSAGLCSVPNPDLTSALPRASIVGIAGYGHAWTVATFDDTGAAAGATSPVFQEGVALGAINYAAVEGKDAAVLDECTYTMYINADGKFTVYDNAETVKKKGGVSKDLGLAGCNIFGESSRPSPTRTTRRVWCMLAARSGVQRCADGVAADAELVSTALDGDSNTELTDAMIEAC